MFAVVRVPPLYGTLVGADARAVVLITGKVKMEMRLKPPSVTYRRLVLGSKVISLGVDIPFCAKLKPFVVKFPWPSTVDAFIPLAILLRLKARTRMLVTSD